MSVRHRPTVRAIGATDLHGPTYQARCTCGTSGPERREKTLARMDRDAHVADLGTPAPERRCRTPGCTAPARGRRARCVPGRSPCRACERGERR